TGANFFFGPCQKIPRKRHFTFGGEHLGAKAIPDWKAFVREAGVKDSDFPANEREEKSGLQEEPKLLRAYLAALLEAIGDAAWIKDGELRYVAVNSGFLRVVGRSAEHVIGRTVRDLTAPERADKYERDDRAALDAEDAGATLEEVELSNREKRLLAVVRR